MVRHTLVVLVTAAVVSAEAQQLPVRTPLERSDVALVSPTTYLKRTRTDPRTGIAAEYDPQPRFVAVDSARGLYRMQWVGYDGKTKSILYERPDKLDAIVVADANRLPSGIYRYRFQIQVQSQSKQPLHHFVVQTFSSEAAPVKQPGVSAGTTNTRVGAFANGAWFMFSVARTLLPQSGPGRTIAFEMDSKAPPGLVDCRASGVQGGLDGAGEEPPAELFDALPGYNAWLRGRTIGPTAALATQSRAQQLAQFREWLPQFERAGWLSATRRQHYDQIAARGDSRALMSDVASDLKNGTTTSEVAAIVRGFNQ
jgi:hypothetical protein